MRVEECPVTLGDSDAHALEEVALPAVGGPAALALRLLSWVEVKVAYSVQPRPLIYACYLYIGAVSETPISATPASPIYK